MMLRSAWLGRISRDTSGCPVTGDVSDVASHCMIADRSYVCPSPLHSTGSTKMACVSGHSIHSGAGLPADTLLPASLS